MLPSPFAYGLVSLGVDSQHSCRNGGQNSVENAVLGKISFSWDFCLRSRRNVEDLWKQSVNPLLVSQPATEPLETGLLELVPKQHPGVFNNWAV